MGRRRATAHRRAAAYSLGAGRARVTLCLSCRKSTSGVEERRQERGFWKGVAWLEADDLLVMTSKTPKSPRQPQAELSPQSRTRGSGLPTERAWGVPPASAPQDWLPGGPASAMLHYFFGVHTDKIPSPCCCPVSGCQGGSHGFRLVSITLLGPHWSASPRGLLDTASACRSVGTPGRLLGDPLSLQCACVLGTRSTTSG